ncbi:MAG: NAD-dependent epimerase/dehydratase family protein, partial [Chloroflexi bacterium]
MRVLISGAAGFLGSHLCERLLCEGHSVIGMDNFVTGSPENLAHIAGNPRFYFVRHDVSNFIFVPGEKVDAVMHFASFIQVGESVRRPGLYYRNNFAYTLNLLDAMVLAGVKRFIFSSTAAIFGEPEYVPLDERHPQRPINPYGMSKQMVEHALGDYDRAHGMKSVCLRYFNAAGAHPDGSLGER